MLLLKNWNRELLLLQQKLEGIRDGKIDIEKTDYLKIIKEEERSDDDQPVAEESKQLWGNI